MRLQSVVLLLAALLSQLDAANVLVLSPVFGVSHMNFMAHLADTLTDAGHNVTFLVPVADASLKHHLGVKSTKDVVIVEQDEIMLKDNLVVEEEMDMMWTIDTHQPNFDEMFSWFDKLMQSSCPNFLRNKQVYESMKAKHFDVAILEPVSVCGLGYFKKLGIEKTILASSCSFYDFVLRNTGEPLVHSYVPSLSGQTGEKMSLYDRYQNYKLSTESSDSLEKIFDKETAIYRKHLGDDIPHWRELLPAASLFFINSNPYLDFPRPVIQKTVSIGGISVNMKAIKATKLDEEWNAILDKRPKTMLISFGSMVKSSQMPIAWKENILKVIKSEPDVTFIWKYESDDTSFANSIPNVHFSKWVPQTALLNDARLTAFFTHGGLGSVNEVAYCAKPAVTVPIFGDQVRNANMLARHNGAIFVWKTELGDFGVLKRAVHEILYNEEYARHARKLADILTNQPHSPKELVVKHTEFLARHGPFPQLDPYGRHLNQVSLNLLDVYGLMWLAYMSPVLIIATFVYYCFTLSQSRSQKLSESKTQ